MVKSEYSDHFPGAGEPKTSLSRGAIVFAADRSRPRITEQVRADEDGSIGGLIKRFRTSNNISQREFVEHSALSHSAIYRYETGSAISLSSVIPLMQAIEGYNVDQRLTDKIRDTFIDSLDARKPDEDSVKEELVRMKEKSEEHKWTSTILHSSLEDAKLYIQLAEGLRTTDFIKEGAIGRSTIARKPKRFRPSILNSMIETSGLAPYGEAAQLLRIKNHGVVPLTTHEFMELTFGARMKYLRILRGETQAEVGRSVGKDQSDIAYLEKDSKTLLSKGVRIARQWLQFADDDPFGVLILNPHARLTEDDPNSKILIASDYLFAENVSLIPPYPMSLEDESLLGEIKQPNVKVGTALSLVRQNEKMTREQVAGGIGDRTYRYSYIEEGSRIPEARKVVRIARVLGFDIHHPITHRLIAIQNRA